MPKSSRHARIPEELLEAVEVVPVKSGINSGLIWVKKLTRKAEIGEEACILKHDYFSDRKDWTIQTKNRTYLAARVLYTKVNKQDPADFTVDHIDGDTLNNNPENLRLATKRQQQINRKTPCTNTSGAKGVSWSKRRKKWEVTITSKSKKHYIGAFNCKIEAAKAYNNAALIYHELEFTQLNKIELISCDCVCCTKKPPRSEGV